MASVENLMEDVVNPLAVDAAFIVARKFRLILKIALHLSLRLEAASREAF
ncbi:hypothetical protein [Sphingobium terrigena]|nr:hypothetical protein [Sphingobium terrigena]